MRDVPIKSANEERLGLKTHADALAEFISQCDTPITIGIQGDWGIGKTSLLNMLLENLKSMNKRSIKYSAVKVETWQYSQLREEESLAAAVLEAINQAVIDQIADLKMRQERAERNRKLFAKLGKAIGVAATGMLKDKLGVDTDQLKEVLAEDRETESFISGTISENLEKLKDEFKSLIDEILDGHDGKVVIMLDDLDRIKPVRAVEILEAIKNFMDVERTVFVLAIDYSVIRQGVREKFIGDENEFYGKSFFDKIIQVPFNMPISAYKVEDYVMYLMGWTKGSNRNVYVKAPHYSDVGYLSGTKKQYISVEDAEFFVHVMKLTTNNNPRAIKRVLNYANLLRIIYRSNKFSDEARGFKQLVWSIREAKIILAVAAMHLAWPELFHYFARNPTPASLELLKDPGSIEGIPEIRPMLRRSADSHRTVAQISGLIDILISALDENSDGTITSVEFLPLWEVLTKANLTNVRMSNLENDIDEFFQLAKARVTTNDSLGRDVLDEFKKLLLESKWNNPVRIRLLEAGQYTRHIEWDKEIIGSLVTKKSAPLELYLISAQLGWSKSDDGVSVNVPQSFRGYVRPFPHAHMGLGDLKVDMQAILRLEKGKAIASLDALIDEVMKYRQAKKDNFRL